MKTTGLVDLLLVQAGSSAIPLFDTTDLHTLAAVDLTFGDRAGEATA